jgi:hypothetical protein
MADRREFTKAVKDEIKARSGGKCECYRMEPDIIHLFPINCQREARDIDHIFADILDLEKDAPLTAEDGAHLSVACHGIKTVTDQKYRAKRNRHTVRKDRPKPGWFQSGQKMKSRGFDKTHTKRFDGSVVRRDGA